MNSVFMDAVVEARDGKAKPFPWTKEWYEAKGTVAPPNTPSHEQHRAEANSKTLEAFRSGSINIKQLIYAWIAPHA